MQNTYFKNKQRGAALIIVIFFFIVISLSIIQSATVGAVTELRTYRTLATSKFAYVAAEAGVEDVFYRTINTKLVPASETITLNGASATINVVNTSASQIDIYSTGNANNEIRKVYLSISKNKNVSFPYGAQIGEGGVTMGNNAKIDGSGLAKGDIYADGQIVGNPGVIITGNAISSSGLIDDQIASSTSCLTDETVGKLNPSIDYAQSFQMSGTSSTQLSKVSLYLKRNGVATGANVLITADYGGQPTTTALAIEPLSYSSVSTTYGWVDVNFTTPPTLNPGTTYWIVFDSTQSASKYWFWCRSNTDTYATGTPLYKQDYTTAGAWSTVTGDLTFKTTFGGGVSKIDSVSVSGTAKADAITNSTITGSAYYKSISSSSVGGTSNPGSVTPPYIPLPISSSTITQWKSDALGGGVINGNCGAAGNAACNTFPLSIGPKQINGNFSVDGTVNVTGTLFVTGNITFTIGKTIQCAFAYLGNSCIVIADGYINIANNAVLLGSGTSGSFLMMLSTLKGCTGAGSGGQCISNSSAINVSNNVSGALFYTTDSLIDITNNAVVTAVVGYMLSLSNNTQILYNNSVTNMSFRPSTVGVTGAWNANRWNEY